MMIWGLDARSGNCVGATPDRIRHGVRLRRYAGDLSPPRKAAAVPDADALGQQVRNILEALDTDATRHDAHVAIIEQRGWRIVEGGQVSGYEDGKACDYECRDWRTGATLFTGRGTYEDFCREVDEKAGEEGRDWIFIENVPVNATDGESTDWEHAEPVLVPGIPASLVEPLLEWVENAAAIREIADIAGLPAERVEHMLRNAGRPASAGV